MSKSRHSLLYSCPLLVVIVLLAGMVVTNAAPYLPGPPIVFDDVLTPSASVYYTTTNRQVTFTAYAYDIDAYGDPTTLYDKPLTFTWWGTEVTEQSGPSTTYTVTRNGQPLELQKCQLFWGWLTAGTKFVHLKVDDHPYYGNDNPIYWDFTIVVDDTPPSIPVVTDDGDSTSYSDHLHASWSATDDESGIAGYNYAIGTSPTDPGSGYVVG